MSGTSLIAIGGGGVVVIAWLAVKGTQSLQRRAKIRQRMGTMADLLAAEAADSAPVPVQAREQQEATEKSALAARLDARYPLAGGIRATSIAGASGLLALLVLVLSMNFFGVPLPLVLIISPAIATGLGFSVGGLLEEARRTQFSDRFLTVLEDFHRMVRFGITANQALNSIAAAAEAPVKSSLRNIVLEVEFGVPIGTAMDREARRVRISDLSMLAAIVSTQSSTGGNLSESVANLAATLRERLDNRSRMKSSTAESRITMIILALVPFAAVGLYSVMQPELVDLLISDARHLLGIGVALIVAGLVVSWILIRNAQR